MPLHKFCILSSFLLGWSVLSCSEFMPVTSNKSWIWGIFTSLLSVLCLQGHLLFIRTQSNHPVIYPVGISTKSAIPLTCVDVRHALWSQAVAVSMKSDCRWFPGHPQIHFTCVPFGFQEAPCKGKARTIFSSSVRLNYLPYNLHFSITVKTILTPEVHSLEYL